MDRTSNNNDLYVNFRRYVPHLSLFGRKVFDNLANKWAEDRRQAENTCLSYQSHVLATQRHQDKKVLTFLSDDPTSATRPPARPQPPITGIRIPNENGNTDEDPINFNVVMNHLLPVPTSKELFQTVESPTRTSYGKIETDKSIENSEVNLTTYDMITQVLDADKSRNMSCDSYTGPSKDVYVDQAEITRNDKDVNVDQAEITRNDKDDLSVAGPNINWNNMFDIEFLSDDATKNAKLIKQSAIDLQNIENSLKPTVSSPIKKNKCNDKISKSRNISDVKQNVKKSKRQTANANDAHPTKIKKTNELDKPPKISFRKQKYSKTVKNWLDDVNPNISVDEEMIPVTTNTEEISKNTSVIAMDTNEEKPLKKVVQARLANKDGKMKFKNPKANQESETASGKTEISNIDKTKQKKSKTKFVAPIKSQLTVKDVAYDVVIIDETNISEHAESLCMVKNRDLINVLVYSNGFSQLNNHHTEDPCDPEGFIINVEERFYYFKGVHKSFRKTIESVLENNKIICFEGKCLLMYLKSKFDLNFRSLNLFDAKIGGCIIDPENPPENFSDIQKLLSYTPQYTIATECVLQKAAWYTSLLKETSAGLKKLLEENHVWSVFENIEMKLVPVIAEMELRGVTVDLQKLKTMEDILLAKMKDVEQECYRAAGKTFHINSAVQIRNIIYDELQLDTKCNIKIKETIMKGAKSTSETMLRSLVAVHPLPKLILEYRHLHKAHATFLTGIAQQVKDGSVRPTWVQTAAATGRIASNNPNLQAIPKAPFSLNLFPDDPTSANQTLSIRSVYTSRPGHWLLAADFQHVECRVFAHCAGDAMLLGSLQEGGDLFRVLAAKWLNKPESDISPGDRERTKRIVYASLYGAGCQKLMDILGVSYEQTLAVIASFNRTFPSLKSFGRTVVSRCEQSGGRVWTLGGRARRLRNISSPELCLRAQAERQAVNFVVQGSAADLCKMAMVLTTERLRSHSPPIDGCLLLQIHDELVWEIRDEHLDTAAALIKEAMEGCGGHCGMAASLPVALSAGRDWGQMAPYRSRARH